MSQPLRSGALLASRFEIDLAAGAGGMGAVYRALDRATGQFVALKVLQRLDSDPIEAERFLREAQLLAELRHSGIVEYVAHGVTPDGERFLAMEWLDGEDLASRLSRGPMMLGESLRLLTQAASALQLAHRRNIVHRDIKPSNLFLVHGDVGQVKLIDFGIARRVAAARAMTRTGLVVGTPEYMAPEQARGVRDITLAADIFALGCVFYECLTGEPPFAGEHIAAVLVRILFEEPLPLEERLPGIPPAISELVHRMLAKEPAQRLADASALSRALEEVGEVHELPLRPTLAAPQRDVPSFAEREQVLFSLVVASIPMDAEPMGLTVRPTDEQSEVRKRQAVLSSLHSLGVHADYLLGGSLVVTIPQTGSATDQVALAARVGLLIREQWPAAEVAVATGRGMVRGVTAVGEVADRAAQLLQRGKRESPDGAKESQPGIWLDELSTRLLGPRFAVTLTDAGALLTGEERDADASRPLLGRPTPCVGRDTELAILDSQLSASIEDSDARAVLITAAPGIGKSRLRHEFLRRVEKRESPVTVMLGRGDPISAGAPYAILGQAIRRLCGLSGSEPLPVQREHLCKRIGQHLRASAQDRSQLIAFLGELSGVRFPDEEVPGLRAIRQDTRTLSERIRHAFVDWMKIEADATPVLLVLDDLQWADALTVSLIEETLRELHSSPLLVLALARPEVHDAFPRLRQRLKLQELPLKGLNKKACERLIQQVLGKQVTSTAIGRAIEQAAGNALFLEELIRSMSEQRAAQTSETPETVVAMLQARIGRMESGPRRAVRAAAVFGQTFWSGGVAAVLGLPRRASAVQDWLGALIDAEVIEERADSRLVDEVEYGFRHALVRDAAYGLLTDSDLVTGHRLAGEFLESGGEREAAVIAEHFQRGGELERAAPLFLQAGDEAARLGLISAARQHFAAAVSILGLGTLGNTQELRRLHAQALIKQTGVSLSSDPREQNLQRLDAAEALVSTQLACDPPASDPEARGDKRLLARIHYLRGRVNFYGGNSQAVALWYQRALAQAQVNGDSELAAVVAMALGTQLSLQGQVREAYQLLTQALELVSQLGNELETVRAHIWMGLNEAQLGAYQDGVRHIEETEAQATQLKHPVLAFSGRVLRASCHRCGMNWTKMLDAVRHLGAALAQQGEKVIASIALSLEEWAHVQLGQRDEAASVHKQLLALSEQIGCSFPGSDWFAAAYAEAALLSGDPHTALRMAQDVVATSGPANLLISWVIAERIWATALSRLGSSLDEVSRHMEESLRIARSAELRMETAHTELWWGRALHERGEPAAAQPHFHRALAIFEQAGCSEAAAHVRSWLG